MQVQLARLDKYVQERELTFLWLSKILPVVEKSERNLSQMPWRWMQSSFSVLADTSLGWNRSELFSFRMQGGGKGSFLQKHNTHQGLVTRFVHVPHCQADGWLMNKAHKQGRAEGSGCPEGCTSPLQWEKPPSNAIPRVRASLPSAPSGWQKGHWMVLARSPN